METWYIYSLDYDEQIFTGSLLRCIEWIAESNKVLTLITVQKDIFTINVVEV